VTPTAVAPAVGPVLGGLLVTDISWRWVFYVNLPIGAAALLFGYLCLEEQREAAPGRFDVPGFLLSGIGFALLMYGISDGPARGWGSPLVLGSIVVGAVLVAVMVHVELRTAEPLLRLRLFGNRLFRSGSLVLVVSVAAFLGVLYVAPLFFQIGLGLDALQSGLNTFPEAIGIMIGAQFASRLFYPRIGPRRLVAAGLLGVAVSMSLMTQISSVSDLWWMRLLMFTMGLCQAQSFISVQAAAFATVSHADTAQGSSLFNSQRQLGSALGVALLSSVLSLVGTVHVVGGHAEPHLAAYHVAFVVGAVLAVVASLTALSLNDADAAPTMVRRRRGREAEPSATEAELSPA